MRSLFKILISLGLLAAPFLANAADISSQDLTATMTDATSTQVYAPGFGCPHCNNPLTKPAEEMHEPVDVTASDPLSVSVKVMGSDFGCPECVLHQIDLLTAAVVQLQDENALLREKLQYVHVDGRDMVIEGANLVLHAGDEAALYDGGNLIIGDELIQPVEPIYLAK